MLTCEDRVVEHPNRFKLVKVEGATDEYDLIPTPGEITKIGTPINKALFDSIKEDFDDIMKNGYIIGKYTGDGASSRFIDLGFTPSAVYVQKQKPRTGNNQLYAGCFGLATQEAPMYNGSYVLIKIVENGMEVHQSTVSAGRYDQDTNTSGSIYSYIAFK